MQILKASQASELSFENNDVMGEPSLASSDRLEFVSLTFEEKCIYSMHTNYV